MAVFRIERTRDYTVMSNHHLRNGKLSLKAKGLLSMMLSLPEDWKLYHQRACRHLQRGRGRYRRPRCGSWKLLGTLSAISCETGRVGSAIPSMLSTSNHSRRTRIRPQPDTASPDTENPDMVKPDTEKPAELNIEKSNTEKTITYDQVPIPFPSGSQWQHSCRNGKEGMRCLSQRWKVIGI